MASFASTKQHIYCVTVELSGCRIKKYSVKQLLSLPGESCDGLRVSLCVWVWRSAAVDCVLFWAPGYGCRLKDPSRSRLTHSHCRLCAAIDRPAASSPPPRGSLSAAVTHIHTQQNYTRRCPRPAANDSDPSLPYWPPASRSRTSRRCKSSCRLTQSFRLCLRLVV